jgi:hypothetical protein
MGGVDALLGKQTREQSDLDLVTQLCARFSLPVPQAFQ